MADIDYLLHSGEPWTVYRTLIDLAGYDEHSAQAQAAKKDLLAHPLVQGLLGELLGWPGTVISSHKSAGQLFHKLAFLADIGLNKNDGRMAEIGAKVLEHRDEHGLICLPTEIPVRYGGSGETAWAWSLCDAPLNEYSAAKAGLADEAQTRKAVEYLLTFQRENGFPCAVSEELGSFRGPGRKEDPCPYVNLLMLKLLALYVDTKQSSGAKAAVQCLLNLWANSRTSHPYIFYMGNDFRKLKVPFIWYDILHVADALSQYDEAAGDARFQDMLAVINAKADTGGLFSPESDWKVWKELGFASKNKPSPWLTFLVARINKRAGNA